MDLPRLLVLYEHWKTNPPLVLTAHLIAQAVGVEFTTKTDATASESSLDELLANIPERPLP